MIPFFHFCLVASFILRSIAIEVAPSSSCSNLCIDQPGVGDITQIRSSTTQPWTLLCNDTAFDNNLQYGRKFKQCLSCQANSTRVDPASGENDVQWFLFNMKYTIDYCLYGVDNKDVPVLPNTCTNECSPLSFSLLDRVKQTNSSIQYQYCSSTDYGDNSFANGVDSCSSCLSNVGNQTYLASFFKSLKSACEQKPAPGSTVSLSASLFPSPTSSSISTKLTSTVTSITATLTTGSAGNNSALLSTAIPTNTTTKHSPLNAGAGIGIGVAIGVASFGVAGLLAAWFMLRRRKRAVKPETPELCAKSRQFRAELHHSTAPPSFRSEPDIYQRDRVVKQELEAEIPPMPPPKSPRGNLPAEIGTNSLYEYDGGSSKRRSGARWL